MYEIAYSRLVKVYKIQSGVDCRKSGGECYVCELDHHLCLQLRFGKIMYLDQPLWGLRESSCNNKNNIKNQIYTVCPGYL